MVAVADEFAGELATLVAVIVTVGGFGAVAGAVYSPLAEMLPPVALQFTAVFEEFKTVALNCCVAEGASVTLTGDTVTVTGGGGGVCTVTVAVPLEDGAAALVARIVTVAGLGTAAGAV
jgi:hypothetical protein